MTVPTAPADASCPAPVCKPSAEATQTPCGRSQASSGVLEADPLTCESNQCQCPVPLPGPAAQLTQHMALQTTGLQLSRHILCLVPAGSLGGHSRVLGATRAVPCHLGATKGLVWGAENGDRAGRPALQAGGRPHGAGPIPPTPALLGSAPGQLLHGLQTWFKGRLHRPRAGLRPAPHLAAGPGPLRVRCS